MFEKSNLIVPLGELCKKMEGTYSFEAPSDIKPIGSWTINSLVKHAKSSVDLCVQMPAEFFNERDFLNYRYFLKRNLYMAHVIMQLMEKKKYANLDYEFTAGFSSTFKPLVSLKFESN